MKNMMLTSSKIKSLKKIMSLILILTILLLPFTNILSTRAEGVTINVDENTKVIDTTNLIVTASDSNEDVFKAYKVLDVYYDNKTNAMRYEFTPEFSNFLKTSGDTKLASLTVDDYMAYGNIDSTLSEKDQKSIQEEYNNMIENFARYIKKGTNTLPKNYELTNTVGVSKTATVEVGSYLVLPAVISDTPYIYEQQLQYNYYSAMIANAVYQVENGAWVLHDCQTVLKSKGNAFVSFIADTPTNKFIDNFGNINPSANAELYMNKEYTLVYSIANREYDYQQFELKITLPEGVVFSDDTSDLNNIYNVIMSGQMELKQTTADGKIYGEIGEDGNPKVYGTVKAEDVTTNKEDGTSITNKVITVTLPEKTNNVILIVSIKLNSNTEKVVLGTAGNTIKSDFTVTVDPYTDPVTTRTLTSENKAITYGLEIANKSKSDSSYLTGAVFGIYTDAGCTDDNKVGELNVNETIDSQVVGRYLGLPSGTYYIKQLKAATGYKIASDIASITIESTSTSYVHLDVENAKQGLLPSTGGLGTIFYTLMGLLVIGTGAYSIIKYSKKQINS